MVLKFDNWRSVWATCSLLLFSACSGGAQADQVPPEDRSSEDGVPRPLPFTREELVEAATEHMRRYELFHTRSPGVRVFERPSTEINYACENTSGRLLVDGVAQTIRLEDQEGQRGGDFSFDHALSRRSATVISLAPFVYYCPNDHPLDKEMIFSFLGIFVIDDPEERNGSGAYTEVRSLVVVSNDDGIVDADIFKVSTYRASALKTLWDDPVVQD